jgi:hypothetical protein
MTDDLVHLGSAESSAASDPTPVNPDTTDAMSDTGEAAAALDTSGYAPVDLRNFSIKCGRCGAYQSLIRFRRLDEHWNEYTYECDTEPCVSDEHRSRTLLEIPVDLDLFARRDPAWRGGKIHAGAD